MAFSGISAEDKHSKLNKIVSIAINSIKFENDVKISFTLEDFDIYAPEKYFTQIVELFFKEFLPEKLCYLIEKRLYCKRKAIDQLPDKLIFEIGDTYFNLPLKRYFKTTWTVGLFEFIITSKPSMDSNTFTFGINMFENHLRVFDYQKQDDEMAALHAKTIVVDEKELLVSSANLSYLGMQGNVEMGIRLVSEDKAKQVESLLKEMVGMKVFKELRKD